MDAAIESLLRCPRTRTPLRKATADELRRIQTQLPCEAAYITSAAFAYPVVGGIPLLRPDDALAFAIDVPPSPPPSLDIS